VVDALLHSQDALRLLTEEITAPKGVKVDLQALVKELEAASSARPAAPSGGQASARLNLDDAMIAIVRSSIQAGRGVFKLKAALQDDSQFKAVRAFQLLTELGEVSQVVTSLPSLADIEAERAGPEFLAVLISDREADAVRQAALAVQDVVAVEVVPFEPAAAPAAAAPDPQHAPAAGPAQHEADPPATDDHHGQPAQTVRIDVERLDHLMNLIGELVIDRTRIEQIGRSLAVKYRDDDLVDALGRTSAHVVKVVNDLQEDFMKVRMLPIGTVFSAFPRMMRDLAKKLGKQIDFRVSGNETEIDKTVIERIRDPLVHLLRNSLDHGMETPEQRARAGKPAEGVIELSAYHEQGHIVIKVQDDGRGVDAEKIKASAVSKGLITPEAAALMDHAEALRLIFLPGTSTKDQATEVSGRGVGLDIVRTNIEAINGFIQIETQPGQGATFTMRLPLTLATVHSVLVRGRETLCAIPLVYVLEAVRVGRAEVSTLQGNEVFRMREKVIPLLDIADATGMKSDAPHAEREFRHVVVVKAGDGIAGLAVDELLDPIEVVVKALGKNLGDLRGLSGASILGDGRVILILDIPTLIASVFTRGAETRRPRQAQLPAPLPELAAWAA
jgi:two-component system chemotaxis sensor kinase CheA